MRGISWLAENWLASQEGRLNNYQSHTAKRLLLTYRLKLKNYMATCFGVFIYAIIRPADIEVNFYVKLYVCRPDNGVYKDAETCSQVIFNF
jgi:hypothetical protein